MKSKLAALALVLVCFYGPTVYADTITNYTIVSTGSGVLPTGTILYDTTTNQFQSFLFNWNGANLDVTYVSNCLATNCGGPWPPPPVVPAGCAGPTSAATLLNVLTDLPACGVSNLPGHFMIESNQVPFSSDFEATCTLDVPEVGFFQGACGGAGITSTAFGEGQFGVVPTSTPEPTSAILLLLAIGIAFVLCRRFAVPATLRAVFPAWHQLISMGGPVKRTALATIAILGALAFAAPANGDSVSVQQSPFRGYFGINLPTSSGLLIFPGPYQLTFQTTPSNGPGGSVEVLGPNGFQLSGTFTDAAPQIFTNTAPLPGFPVGSVIGFSFSGAFTGSLLDGESWQGSFGVDTSLIPESSSSFLRMSGPVSEPDQGVLLLCGVGILALGLLGRQTAGKVP
jgi:hypothetical protein